MRLPNLVLQAAAVILQAVGQHRGRDDNRRQIARVFVQCEHVLDEGRVFVDDTPPHLRRLVAERLQIADLVAFSL